MNSVLRWCSIIALSTPSVAAYAAQSGAAQTYPSRPVRFLIGWPAGGPTDAAGRIVSQSLSQALGQNVLIDNRPGADGAIAMEMAANAAADGYNLLLANASNIAGAPTLRKNLPFDTVRDFAPITFVAWSSNLLVVHPGVPAKTLGELIQHAKANPGKLIVAAANPPTIFAMAQVKSAAKLDLLSVPYKGDVAAMPDVIAGRAHILTGGTNALLPHVKEGRLRALAALTRARTAPAPDVPTIVEAGVPNFSIYNWFALFGPAKVPAAVSERMHREVQEVLKRPEAQAQFAKIGFELGNAPSRQALPGFVKEQVASWAAAARESGIQPQ